MRIGTNEPLPTVRVSTPMHRAYVRYARKIIVVYESGTIIPQCFPLDEAHSMPTGLEVEEPGVKSCVENVAGIHGPANLRRKVAA